MGRRTQFEENSRHNEPASLFAAWTRIQPVRFAVGLRFFGVRLSVAWDHYYYGRQNQTRSKKLPRSLLEQTPEDVTASKKRRSKVPIVATPKRSRARLDLLTKPALGHEDDDSDKDMEAVAQATTVVPETAMSDMCEEAVGEWHAPPDPRFVHLAGRPNISTNPPPRPASPWAVSHNLAHVPSNQQATVSPTTSVSLDTNHNLPVDYLRYFKDEKIMAVCKSPRPS
jgi:hypothetical protein